jgi:hypothetical protein
MKQLLIFSAITLILLASNVSVHADLAPPLKPSEQKGKVVMNARLEIVPNENALEARLQIPRARLGELRAALANDGGDESAVLGVGLSSSRTIIAGLFLFMSLSFAGIWLARAGHSRAQKVAAALVLGIAVIAATAIITQANAGLPPGFVWHNLPQNLSAGRSTRGQLKVEIVSEDNGLKLILPVTVSDKKTGKE